MSDPIAELLESLDPGRAAVVGRYLDRARALVPEAEAGRSYAMPALIHRGKALVAVMATKPGFSAYPFSGKTVSEVMARHPGIEHTRGSVHFTEAQPLPGPVFDDLVLTRAAAIDAAAGA